MLTIAGNIFSKCNDEFAYWCPDCDYKTNVGVNLDIHIKLNHSTPSHDPTNEDLMDAIEVWKIYKLLQRMKNTHLLNKHPVNPKFKTHQAQV